MSYKHLQFPKRFVIFSNREAIVAHKEFVELDGTSFLKEKHVIFDVKGFLKRNIVDGRL